MKGMRRESKEEGRADEAGYARSKAGSRAPTDLTNQKLILLFRS